MRGKRNVVAVLGFAVLGIAPLLAVAAPAGAQDPEYPPGTCRLSLNASVAERGQTVLASTVNCTSPYEAVVSVDLYANSDPIYLTTTTSNDDGQFSDVAFVVPAQIALGQHSITSVGPGSDVDTLVLDAPLTVVAPGGGGPIVNPGGTTKADGGGLAFTGANTLPLLFLALVLLTIGTALVLAARRRAEVRRRVAS